MASPSFTRNASPRNAAMNLLARREHSRLELSRKLQRRFDRRELEQALDKLADEGLQSDERFALSFTRERLLRGQGPLRIVAELRARGISSELASRAVDVVPDEEGTSWREQAELAVLRKFGADECLDIQERARRARFLAYRGFRSDDVRGLDD